VNLLLISKLPKQNYWLYNQV